MRDNLTTRTNNSLTQANAAKLREWLNGRKQWAAGTIAQHVAADATEVLGFTVTKSNVLFHKRSLGIVKPAPVAPANGCRCHELAAALVVLFKQAGSSPPPCVVEIAAGRKPAAQTEALPFPVGVGS